MRLRFYASFVIALLLCDNPAQSTGVISEVSFKCQDDPGDIKPYHQSYPPYVKVLDEDARNDAEQRCQLASRGHAYDIVITFADGTQERK
jgi:hypothetical protein